MVEIVNFCTKILPLFLHSKNDQNMIQHVNCGHLVHHIQ
jgi:hypothetical protein